MTIRQYLRERGVKDGEFTELVEWVSEYVEPTPRNLYYWWLTAWKDEMRWIDQRMLMGAR